MIRSKLQQPTIHCFWIFLLVGRHQNDPPSTQKHGSNCRTHIVIPCANPCLSMSNGHFDCHVSTSRCHCWILHWCDWTKRPWFPPHIRWRSRAIVKRNTRQNYPPFPPQENLWCRLHWIHRGEAVLHNPCATGKLWINRLIITDFWGPQNSEYCW